MLATALQTIGKFTIKKKAGEGEQKDKLFGRCVPRAAPAAVPALKPAAWSAQELERSGPLRRS
jgi:hypothetical protein